MLLAPLQLLLAVQDGVGDAFALIDQDNVADEPEVIVPELIDRVRDGATSVLPPPVEPPPLVDPPPVEPPVEPPLPPLLPVSPPVDPPPVEPPVLEPVLLPLPELGTPVAAEGVRLASTVIVVLTVVGPLAFVHVREYVFVSCNAPVFWLPTLFLTPVHAPDAAHTSASFASQATVAEPPGATFSGVVVKVIVGVPPSPPTD